SRSSSASDRTHFNSARRTARAYSTSSSTSRPIRGVMVFSTVSSSATSASSSPARVSNCSRTSSGSRRGRKLRPAKNWVGSRAGVARAAGQRARRLGPPAPVRRWAGRPGPPPFAAGPPGLDGPGPPQPLDGVVQRAALQVEELVLLALADEALHLVGVHRPLA